MREGLVTIIVICTLLSPHALAVETSLPSIVESGPKGTKTLLSCSANQMPVLTEGPTDEVIDGKRLHSAQGLLKCVDLTEDVRDVEAGGSGSLNWTDGRKLEVRNCAKGTVPLVWQLTNYSIEYDPTKPALTQYQVFAPVIVRCVETALLGPVPQSRRTHLQPQ